MTYVEFINKNKPQLILNYICRGNFNEGYSFAEFCSYIHKGFEVGAWLPDEFILGIKYYKNKENK